MSNTQPNHGRGSDESGKRPTPATKTRQFLPLTVWLCPDEPDHDRQARSAHLCSRHRRSISLGLARHLIYAATAEKEVVIEAFTTGPATLRAAAELDRRGIGCVPHLPLAQYIGAHLRSHLRREHLGRVAMRPCRADQMHLGVRDHLGKTSLIIGALPSLERSLDCPTQQQARDTCSACLSDALTSSPMRDRAFLAGAVKMLRPGGHLAVVTSARHDHDGRLVDPAPRIIRDACAAGLRYTQHIIAVRVPVDGDTLLVQAEPSSIAQLRDIRSRALPPAARVHADVCLFTRPGRAGHPGAAR